MIIVKALNDNMKHFEDVEPGAVFEYENTLYMKISIPQNLNNAVDLIDGEALCFAENKLVELVACSLMIE